jgi:2-beta-glucuronyltransferase
LPQGPKRAVIFSYHTAGFGARKASIVFLAEALAELGWQVGFVTAQLSRLSALVRVPRLKDVPEGRRNVWIPRSDRLSTFVWVPPFHPATTGMDLINRMATPLFALYPHLLPEAIRRRVRSAELVIIESCSAVLLLPLLKKLAPKAKFVYRASDRLNAIGMHPMLTTVLNQTAADYDLFTAPSELILADCPAGVKTCHLPQGLEKSLFHAAVPSPFESAGPHAIIAGDMMFDHASVEMMVKNFPDMTFHTFGRMDVRDLTSYRNLIHHGEVPFETLRDFIVHADIGIAPYHDNAEHHYLNTTSLKLVQYTYARLPILAPHFVKGDRDHVKDYTPGDEASIIGAMRAALGVDRRTIDRSGIYDWREIAQRMLEEVRLDSEARISKAV